MAMLLCLILLIIAFFIGAIPSGYVVGRLLYGVDIRKEGSGNIGATNAKRVLGKKAGLITLVCDLLKGVVALYLATLLPIVAGAQYSEAANLIQPFLGFAAFLGHCYSPFLKFKGGKGVATSLGVFLVLAPVPVLASVVIFVIVVKVSGYVSLGSLLSALAFALLVWLKVPHNYPTGTVLVALFTTVMIFSRHRENILRLIAGTELSMKKANANTNPPSSE